MDRRGHGASVDSADYALEKEAQDVAAVVDSRPGPVFVLGHSYGGVAALESTFFTKRIDKLLLYEPPLQDRIDLTVVDHIEALLRGGEREEAVRAFLREVVRVSPAEVDAMPSRPSWGTFVAAIGSQPRELRALAQYRFDAARMATVRMPTLLITGADTASPYLKEARQLGGLPAQRDPGGAQGATTQRDGHGPSAVGRGGHQLLGPHRHPTRTLVKRQPPNNRMTLTRSAPPTDYRGPCRLSACWADRRAE
jgi:pimeloyl-ACP methyl ester carboxylesterase